MKKVIFVVLFAMVTVAVMGQNRQIRTGSYDPLPDPLQYKDKSYKGSGTFHYYYNANDDTVLHGKVSGTAKWEERHLFKLYYYTYSENYNYKDGKKDGIQKKTKTGTDKNGKIISSLSIQNNYKDGIEDGVWSHKYMGMYRYNGDINYRFESGKLVEVYGTKDYGGYRLRIDKNGKLNLTTDKRGGTIKSGIRTDLFIGLNEKLREVDAEQKRIIDSLIRRVDNGEMLDMENLLRSGYVLIYDSVSMERQKIFIRYRDRLWKYEYGHDHDHYDRVDLGIYDLDYAGTFGFYTLCRVKLATNEDLVELCNKLVAYKDSLGARWYGYTAGYGETKSECLRSVFEGEEVGIEIDSVFQEILKRGWFNTQLEKYLDWVIDVGVRYYSFAMKTAAWQNRIYITKEMRDSLARERQRIEEERLKKIEEERKRKEEEARRKAERERVAKERARRDQLITISGKCLSKQLFRYAQEGEIVDYKYISYDSLQDGSYEFNYLIDVKDKNGGYTTYSVKIPENRVWQYPLWTSKTKQENLCDTVAAVEKELLQTLEDKRIKDVAKVYDKNKASVEAESQTIEGYKWQLKSKLAIMRYCKRFADFRKQIYDNGELIASRVKGCEGCKDIARLYKEYISQIDLSWVPTMDSVRVIRALEDIVANQEKVYIQGMATHKKIEESDADFRTKYKSCKNVMKAYVNYYAEADKAWRKATTPSNLRQALDSIVSCQSGFSNAALRYMVLDSNNTMLQAKKKEYKNVINIYNAYLKEAEKTFAKENNPYELKEEINEVVWVQERIEVAIEQDNSKDLDKKVKSQKVKNMTGLLEVL